MATVRPARIPSFDEARWLRRQERPARTRATRAVATLRHLGADLLALGLRVALGLGLAAGGLAWLKALGLAAVPEGALAGFAQPGLAAGDLAAALGAVTEHPWARMALEAALGLILPALLLAGFATRSAALLVLLALALQGVPVPWVALGAAVLALFGPGRASVEGIRDAMLYARQ